MRKVGLLAGVGRLPVEFARAACGMGFTVISIGVVSGVDEDLTKASAKLYHIAAGQLEKIISVLKEEEVTEITMLGKVTKELMFSGQVVVDARMGRLFASLPDHSDDTIMLAIVRELAAEGIGVLDQTALIRSLMPGTGILTRRGPTELEAADMEFGFSMAKQIGALDIGQTVVVKNKAVMAVEAIEGTDKCILRGGELGRGGVTVAKVAKPGQDLRFDVPSVGVATIHAMIAGGASALVFEAGKTLLVDREKTLALADGNDIAIVAR
jgi:DUF1009 family protein